MILAFGRASFGGVYVLNQLQKEKEALQYCVRALTIECDRYRKELIMNCNSFLEMEVVVRDFESLGTLVDKVKLLVGKLSEKSETLIYV